MDDKEPFGYISAEDLQVGDIVEWSRWSGEKTDWESYYGVIMEIKNEIKGNRLVSISVVAPFGGTKPEIEFFTPSLKLVSRASVAIE